MKDKVEKFDSIPNAKIYLEMQGFPCFHGDSLSYIDIARIFKNVGFVKQHLKKNDDIYTCACCNSEYTIEDLTKNCIHCGRNLSKADKKTITDK